MMTRVNNCSRGCARPRRPWGWPDGLGPCCSWPAARVTRPRRGRWGCANATCASGPNASCAPAPRGCGMLPVPAVRRSFPPEVAVHLVKIACELPDRLGVSLSQWDCQELAYKLAADGVVERISPQTVGRILNHHRLKPWRKHLWLSPNVPRDAAFAAQVTHIVDLYTRPLAAHEVVLSVDEKTSLQPRTRLSPTLPARPDLPVRVEHEYQRKGALNLFAAFDTRTGKVYGRTAERKRQVEFIAFLEQLDEQLPSEKTTVHIVLDNLRMHK